MASAAVTMSAAHARSASSDRMRPDYRNAEYLPGSFHVDPRRSDAFYPAPGGGGASIKMYVYEHTETPTLGAPTTGVVDLYDKDDESTLFDTDVEWVSNLEMFNEQIIGDRGICLLIGEVAYAFNAPCSGGTPSSSTGLHIGTTAPADTTLLWIDTSGL